MSPPPSACFWICLYSKYSLLWFTWIVSSFVNSFKDFYLSWMSAFCLKISISFIDFCFLQNNSMNWILLNYRILSSFSTFFLYLYSCYLYVHLAYGFLRKAPPLMTLCLQEGVEARWFGWNNLDHGLGHGLENQTPLWEGLPTRGAIDISSSSIWTSRPNITIVMSSPPVWSQMTPVHTATE